jgi:DNA-binding HxlR family transcriptional regulator
MIIKMNELQLPNIALTHIPNKIFNPYRLAILISLKIAEKQMRFHELRHSLTLSDGNLASHLKTLEQEEYIQITSTLEGKRLKTFIKITPKGEKVLNEFMKIMEIVLKSLSKNKLTL